MHICLWERSELRLVWLLGTKSVESLPESATVLKTAFLWPVLPARVNWKSHPWGPFCCLPPHIEGTSLNGSKWSKSSCYISRCQEGWKQTSFHSAFVGGSWWDMTSEPVHVWWNNSRQRMETLISLCNQRESKGAAPTWGESFTSPPRTSGRSSMWG